MRTPNPSTPEATKHTPGPWTAELHKIRPDLEECPIFGFSIRADGKGAALARAGCSEHHNLILGESGFDNDFRKAFPADAAKFYTAAEVEANAHLIAAAPDMLAQLKKIRNWLIGNADILEKAAKTHERFQSVADEELANAKNYRATAKVVDATIAKAERGQ